MELGSLVPPQAPTQVQAATSGQLATGFPQRSNAGEQRQAGVLHLPAADKQAGTPLHCHSPSPLLLYSSSGTTTPARETTVAGKPGVLLVLDLRALHSPTLAP